MKIRESAFTYKVDDGSGGLLLYNTAIGIDSFCHVADIDVSRYQDMLADEYNRDELKSLELVKKGIWVPDDKDEQALLKSLYIRTVGSAELILIINPTEECNFRCKYCYENFSKGLMDEALQRKLIRFVEVNLHRYTGLKIMWFGGEPLLGMSVIRSLSQAFIEICKNNRKPYSAQLTTNGYLLDYETFVELVKYHVQSFQVTVDGIKDIHDSQRVDKNGRETFNVILKNLLAIRDGRKYPAQIVLRTNFTYTLYQRLDDYIRNFCALFSDDRRFSFDIHLVGNWLGRAEDSVLKDIVGIDMYRTIFQAILEHPVGIKNLATIPLHPAGRVCMAARRNSYLVSSDGSIHKCTLIFGNQESILGQYSASGEKMEIDEDKSAAWIGEWNYCNHVSDCYLAPLCFGEHCPVPRIMGDRQKGDAYCPEIKLYLDLFLRCVHRFQPFETILL